MPLVRLSVLRLVNVDTLFAKEPSDPVVLALRPSPPLSDAQIRRLALAAPWNPVMMEAEVHLERWDSTSNTFEAEIVMVETVAKGLPNHPRLRRRVPPQTLLKQYRGFVSHD
jgi:hypothetical protein